jgi:hypothetical protein
LEPSAADQFEQFAQHLDRPLTKANMEALEALVEHGQQLKKKATKTHLNRSLAMVKWLEFFFLLGIPKR